MSTLESGDPTLSGQSNRKRGARCATSLIAATHRSRSGDGLMIGGFDALELCCRIGDVFLVSDDEGFNPFTKRSVPFLDPDEKSRSLFGSLRQNRIYEMLDQIPAFISHWLALPTSKRK